MSFVGECFGQARARNCVFALRVWAAADQFRLADRQSLYDESSQRKSEYVDLVKVERLDERDGVGGHLLD